MNAQQNAAINPGVIGIAPAKLWKRITGMETFTLARCNVSPSVNENIPY
jgi:hypothetical protein